MFSVAGAAELALYVGAYHVRFLRRWAQVWAEGGWWLCF